MKPLGAGSEIDAWCTRCKLDLGHRVVAMVANAPKRVVCQTCGSEHNYRAPKGALGTQVIRRGDGATAKPARPNARPKAAPKLPQAEAARLGAWEARIAGQPLDAFARFTIAERYGVDALVRHAKFGDGYVLEVLEGDKLAIMFRDGPRTLVHGRS